MIDNKDIYLGADISGGGGGGSTHVECDDLRNNRHYTLAEVNKKGAVMKGSDGRFQRLSVEDLKKDGVQILRGVNDNPILEPGQKLDVAVGSHVVTITGTTKKSVVFNGGKPTKATRDNEALRYPRT